MDVLKVWRRTMTQRDNEVDIATMGRERFAITGAAGFVGGSLCSYLLDSGYDVVAVTRDVTSCTTLEKIGKYDALIKSIITRIVRLKTVDELSGEMIDEVREEIRGNLNKEVFQKLFVVDDENKLEIQVQEVVFSDIIIQ